MAASSLVASPPYSARPQSVASSKMSSRPKSTIRPVARSALSLHNDNVPPVPESPTPPSAMSSPVKLKIKSVTTPEARTRVLAARPRVAARPRSAFPSTEEDVWTSESSGHAALLDSLEPAPTLDANEQVLVSVRVRPHNEAELSRDASSAWICPSYDLRMIKLAKPRESSRENKDWYFDRILAPDTDNARTYATSARAHVHSAMDGYNAVIFAYGQTASGKTFTLTGAPTNPGIIPLAIADLFAQIRATPDREFLLRASYLELYNETIIDLLSPEPGRELTLSESKKKGEVVINGLTECGVRTEDEVRRLLRMGEDRRKVGGTDWNARSSRSHCVFRIVIESRMAADGTRTPGRDKATRISTLSIIDLAGSERHTSSKERNAEGRHINQSLLTLKLVISKLADMASKRQVMHVPYRDSKLTRLLQPSLSGDALISVICTISPSPVNMAESMSTLSFAQGLKRVLLSAQRKEVVDPEALIQQYQNEIAELKARLREKEVGPTSLSSRSDTRGELEGRLNELRSLILTSDTVDSMNPPGTPRARPLSPTKLNYAIEIDKSTTTLQEELHNAQMRVAELETAKAQLEKELQARTPNPNRVIQELQDENGQLKMIAQDYERHLREPDRKVREDVRREFQRDMDRLKTQLENKTTWAHALDNNFRKAARDKAMLEQRAVAAETKLAAVFEWINAALEDEEDGEGEGAELQALRRLTAGPNGLSGLSGGRPRESLDDFGPAMEEKLATLSLNASRMRRGPNQRNLQTEFSDWWAKGQGTIGSVGPQLKGRLLRDESVPVLAAVDDDDVF